MLRRFASCIFALAVCAFITAPAFSQNCEITWNDVKAEYDNADVIFYGTAIKSTKHVPFRGYTGSAGGTEDYIGLTFNVEEVFKGELLGETAEVYASVNQEVIKKGSTGLVVAYRAQKEPDKPRATEGVDSTFKMAQTAAEGGAFLYVYTSRANQHCKPVLFDAPKFLDYVHAKQRNRKLLILGIFAYFAALVLMKLYDRVKGAKDAA